MTFREFVSETLGAARALADMNAGERDLTPMVHMEAPDGRREIVAVEPAFFTEDGGVEQLVDGFIVPLVQERAAAKIAWTFTATARSGAVGKPVFGVEEPLVGDMRIAVVVVFDREVCETWIAPLFPSHVGEWLNLGPNTTEGLMVGPVQEALR